MKSLHPTATGGDGAPILQSPYSYPTDKPDNFISCAQCGFKKDMDRFQDGDTLLSPGISYSAAVTATVRQPVYNGAIGSNFSDTTIEPNVVAGCPFCGSFNSRGVHVGDDFGRMTDLSNL